MRVAVIGATGVLGRHVLPRLVERGHTVSASVRRQADAERIRGLGIEAFEADILEPASLGAVVEGCDAVLHLATVVPMPGAKPRWDLNDRIRREGTQNLMAAATKAGVARYLQQSVAMLLTASDARPQTEDDPVQGSPVLDSAIDMEALVRGADLDWRIVRGGAFYGPGTGRPADWLEAARAGTLELPGDGGAFVSPIHVADMAAAVIAVLEAEAPRSVWNVVDDTPVTLSQLLRHVAALAGAPPPAPGGPPPPYSFRVSNARLKDQLGWAPRYPSIRSGIAD